MKTRGMRDEHYKKWVSSLPCSICHPDVILNPWVHVVAEGFSDPDHQPSLGNRGVSMKTPDYFLVPLCRDCHNIRGRHFRRSTTVLTPEDCRRIRIPEKFADRNFSEIALRILWAYLHPPEGMEAWAI